MATAPRFAEARPDAPTSFTASARASGGIDLQWIETDTAVTGFEIDRSLREDRDYVVVAVLGSATRAWINTSVSTGTTYYYRIRGVHGGTYSERAGPAWATAAAAPLVTRTPTVTPTPVATSSADTTAPTVPGSVSAVAVSCHQVNLSWSAASDAASGVKGYKLYRSGTFIKQVTATTTANAGLSPSATYSYAVSTIDNAGNESGKSAPVAVTMPVCASTATKTPTSVRTATVTATRTATRTPTRTPTRTATRTPTRTATPVPTVTPDSIAPSSPTGLSAVASGCQQVTLSWNASTDNPGGSGLRAYYLFRDGGFVQQIAAPSTTLINAGLVGGRVYTYLVSAFDYAGNQSVASNSATVNTPPCNQPPDADAGNDVSGTNAVAVAFDGTASSDPDGAIMTWAWNFGDGTTGAGMRPTHTYSAGTYVATLTVVDDDGASASDAATVVIAAGTPGSTVRARAAGGADLDAAYGVAVDSGGNVVTIGEFSGTATFGGANLASAGLTDVFLAKYGASGTHQWSRRMGGTLGDRGESVAVDGNGDVVVTGVFEGTVDFGAGPVTASGRDIFLAKYAGATGAHLWSKRFGNTGHDYGYGVATDAGGNVVVVGSFASTVDFGGGTFTSSYGTPDAFVAKYSSAGTHLWSKRFGDSANDAARGVAVDAGGNVAVTGSFVGSVDFGGGVLRSIDGSDDIFVLKLNAAGSHLWSRRYGDAFGDAGYAIAMNAAGEVAVTGQFRLTVDFGGGAMMASGNTPSDAFVLKLSTSGGHVWSKPLGGGGNDSGRGIAIDGNGEVTVTGIFLGTASTGSGSLTSAGDYDIMVVRYASTGTVRWARALGAAGTDFGLAIAVAGSSNVVVAGSFSETVALGGPTVTSAGQRDVLVVTLAN